MTNKKLYKGISNGHEIYAYAYSPVHAIKHITDRAIKLYKSFNITELWTKNGDWYRIPVPAKLSSNVYQRDKIRKGGGLEMDFKKIVCSVDNTTLKGKRQVGYFDKEYLALITTLGDGNEVFFLERGVDERKDNYLITIYQDAIESTYTVTDYIHQTKISEICMFLATLK